MTFNDNSDFAPLVSMRDEQKIVEIEDVERGEDFVQAGVSCVSFPLSSGLVRLGTRQPTYQRSRLGIRLD